MNLTTQTHSYCCDKKQPDYAVCQLLSGVFEVSGHCSSALERHESQPIALTHDLMKNFMLAFNVELHEVIINDLQEGIFYSKLVCSSENDTVEIDSRTSDALALAVRFWLPHLYLRYYSVDSIPMEDDDKWKYDEQDAEKKNSAN